MKKLLQGLREFQTGYFNSHHDLFEQLSHGQKPRVLFIACSDSRVDPNLMTQAQVGELFVIRNAGNIVPPYGAANGGEGAAIEYAIHALGVQQVIVCGHSHCGAMKGLLKLEKLENEMPLVYDWLKHAEATRRLIQENYGGYEGEDLIEATIAENVITQLENLRTYPVIRSKLHQQQIKLFGWLYEIETGEVTVYDAEQHAYVPPTSRLLDYDREVDQKSAAIAARSPEPARTEVSLGGIPDQSAAARSGWFPITQLSPEQAERIYRGSVN